MIFLTFFEPEILVTRTLAFNLVGDGLLIGAAISWIIGRPRVPATALAPAALLAMLAIVFFLWPLVNGTPGWRGLYEGLVIARYPVLIMMAATAFRSARQMKPLLIAMGVGSFVLATAGLVESFHIYRVNSWLYGEFLGWQRIDPEVVDTLARNYARIRGLLGDPLDTGVLLAVSLGAWFVGLRSAETPLKRAVILIGSSIVVFTIFGTGARTAVATAGVSGTLGVAWLFVRHLRSNTGLSPVHLLVVPTVLMIVVMLSPVGTSRTAATAIDRLVRTPNAIAEGADSEDESIVQRLGEFRRTPLTLVGTDSDPRSGRNSEYLSLMFKFGLVGLIPYLLFWPLIGWRAGRTAFSGNDIFRFAVFSVLVTVPVSALGSNTLLDPGVMTIVAITAGAFLGTAVVSKKSPSS